ncbi:amidohydrolase family protein [Chondrinema litorale]|uniref:amidohydrolase family protein n=1 Tax=Chondrinema litorale TaxID=2994555 RepID=UPI002543BD2F|nr:amidohydrolase family protein [Chondrinema litorale]UZR97437.1 amidohydrolase family protein [Chondrinema litorale]
MIKKFIFFILTSFTLFACKKEQPTKFDILILNAQIIDVEQGEVIPNLLIGISQDTIQLVDDMSNKEMYDATEILDAKNKFVMPGLWDMHVHFRGGEALIKENKNLLPLFLAYGITTVRDAGGDITPSVLAWRKAIAEKKLDGPNIFTSGPKLDGSSPAWDGSIKVETAEDIEPALDALEKLGVDYVKMYDGNLSKEMFYGIIEAAEKRGMKTTGHMPLSADFLKAVSLGLDGSEHIYYIGKACSPLADSLTEVGMGYGMMVPIVQSFDMNLADSVYKVVKPNKVSITPTVHVVKTLANILEVDHSNDSILAFLGDGIEQTYQRRIEGAIRAKERGDNTYNLIYKLGLNMITNMYKAGINLVAGSDCGAFNSYVYPGESLHSELIELVESGLTPQEALTTAVVNGPKFFELENYGAVKQGKIGDLILLDQNPLENIENISSINTVIHLGKIYNREKLNAMLNELREEYN